VQLDPTHKKSDSPVWEAAFMSLREQASKPNQTLRLVSASYPSSSVGQWLMNVIAFDLFVP
ncbi:MAG: hypothetical protein KDD89_10535, partial [Anaerolineales bacterium]|nr:hypothetical protein [Anaerolineales bacterium]